MFECRLLVPALLLSLLAPRSCGQQTQTHKQFDFSEFQGCWPQDALDNLFVYDAAARGADCAAECWRRHRWPLGALLMGNNGANKTCGCANGVTVVKLNRVSGCFHGMGCNAVRGFMCGDGMVEVYKACPWDKWGLGKCEGQCYCNNTVCDLEGRCLPLCAPGFLGPDCLHRCPARAWISCSDPLRRGCDPHRGYCVECRSGEGVGVRCEAVCYEPDRDWDDPTPVRGSDCPVCDHCADAMCAESPQHCWERNSYTLRREERQKYVSTYSVDDQQLPDTDYNDELEFVFASTPKGEASSKEDDADHIVDEILAGSPYEFDLYEATTPRPDNEDAPHMADEETLPDSSYEFDLYEATTPRPDVGSEETLTNKENFDFMQSLSTPEPAPSDQETLGGENEGVEGKDYGDDSMLTPTPSPGSKDATVDTDGADVAKRRRRWRRDLTDLYKQLPPSWFYGCPRRWAGNTCKGCPDGRWGRRCDLACSYGCVRCDIDSGNCVEWSAPDMWIEALAQKMGEPVPEVKEEEEEMGVEMAPPTTTQLPRRTSTEFTFTNKLKNDVFFLGAFLAAGGTMTLLIILAIIFFVWRSKMVDRSSKNYLVDDDDCASRGQCSQQPVKPPPAPAQATSQTQAFINPAYVAD